MSQNLQQDILKKGKSILDISDAQDSSIFNKDWWYGKVMDWSMQQKEFKTQMFRFVDVLPNLKSNTEVVRHLREYFSEGGDKLPSIFNFGAGIGVLAPSLLAGTIKKNVTQMARLFITGDSPQDAIKTLEKLRKQKISFTADLLGEACLSEKEALEYQTRYIEMISQLSKQSESWSEVEQLDRNHLGSIPKVNVSVKLSSLFSQIKIQAFDYSKQILKERLRPIFQIAKERGVFINLDLEQYELKELTFAVFKELIMEPEFRQYPNWGIVVQAYLRDSFDEVKSLTEFAKQRGCPFTIRLVKGAYWDFETIDSEQKRWNYPVYTNKAECDANYEACACFLLSNYQYIHTALGSHNIRSLSACFVHAEKHAIPNNAFEIQMLYGMADEFKKTLVDMNYRVRVYAPIGDLLPGMAYLVRRLLENTSNESFLRSKFAEGNSTENLLKDPNTIKQITNNKPKTEDRFYNEAPLNFAIANERVQMQNSIEQSYKLYQKPFPVFVAGKEVKTDRLLQSFNPSKANEVLGSVYVASTVEAEQAVKAALETWKTWRYTNYNERADYIDRLADIIRNKRYEFCALMVREVGKSWSEADGDLTECIDFCKYYARDMRRIGPGIKTGNIPGETSIYHYQSRGVCLVIAPWNFPLAILAGMVAAAAVSGNTVIMKPAEQSSITAALLFECIKEAKIPTNVIQFLPGYGEEVGEYLVNHTGISTIAFTGSKAVGLHIIKQASEVKAGQINVKRCLIEMGGKNAIIIDSDADLDEAVKAVIYSAFGFSGQKCSACSRVIVLEDNYDRFNERLVETAKSIKVGEAKDPSIFTGPVIDQESQQRLLKFIENAKSKHKLLFEGQVPSEGFFVPPVIFADVNYKDSIAQDELFGPVLAVIKAKNLEEAVELANATDYALTGAFFSRSPANIKWVSERFEVGNLYINRGSTGAMVDRHPFGGFKMSGLGSKTGGPDYLLGFMEPRVVTENTLRRGFAPEEN